MTDSHRTLRHSLELLVPFIGSLVSMITKVGIRYVGFLAQFDTNENSITLSPVRSLGTEWRRNGFQELPPLNRVLYLIAFRASHIVDFRVLSPPIQNKISLPIESGTNSANLIQNKPYISESSATNSTTPIQNQASLHVESVVTKGHTEKDIKFKFGTIDFVPVKSSSSSYTPPLYTSSGLKPSTETQPVSAPKLCLPEKPSPDSVSTVSEGPNSIPSLVFGSWPAMSSSDRNDRELDIQAPYATAHKLSLPAVPTGHTEKDIKFKFGTIDFVPAKSSSSSYTPPLYTSSGLKPSTETQPVGAPKLCLPEKPSPDSVSTVSAGPSSIPFLVFGSWPAMSSSDRNDRELDIQAPYATAPKSSLPAVPTLSSQPSTFSLLSSTIPVMSNSGTSILPSLKLSFDPAMPSTGRSNQKINIAAPYANATESKLPEGSSIPPYLVFGPAPVLSSSAGTDPVTNIHELEARAPKSCLRKKPASGSIPSSNSGRAKKSVSFSIPLTTGGPSTPAILSSGPSDILMSYFGNSDLKTTITAPCASASNSSLPVKPSSAAFPTLSEKPSTNPIKISSLGPAMSPSGNSDPKNSIPTPHSSAPESSLTQELASDSIPKSSSIMLSTSASAGNSRKYLDALLSSKSQEVQRQRLPQSQQSKVKPNEGNAQDSKNGWQKGTVPSYGSDDRYVQGSVGQKATPSIQKKSDGFTRGKGRVNGSASTDKLQGSAQGRENKLHRATNSAQSRNENYRTGQGGGNNFSRTRTRCHSGKGKSQAKWYPKPHGSSS